MMPRYQIFFWLWLYNDHDNDDDDDGDDDFGVTGEMTLESQASRIWSHKRDIAR